jgi:tetratricopeptide (TPR) repeat protein
LFSRLRLQLRSGDVREGVLEEVEGDNLILTGQEGPELIEARDVETAVLLAPPPHKPPPPVPPTPTTPPRPGGSPDELMNTESSRKHPVETGETASAAAEPNPVVEEVHRAARQLREEIRHAPPPAYVFARFDATLDVSPVSKPLAAEWNALHDKLSHALRVHETDPRFGRIVPLIGRLRALHRALPDSLLVRRTLAACYRWLEDKANALVAHERLALENPRADIEDFRRWAAVARDTARPEQERCALGELFRRVPLSAAPDLFRRLLRLCFEDRRFEALLGLSRHRLAPMPAEDWRQLTLALASFTALSGDEGRAFRVWSRFRQGQAAAPLVEELLAYLLERFPPPMTTPAEKAPEAKSAPAAQASRPTASAPPPRLGTLQRFKKTFGFLHDDEGKEYFFHHSELCDAELRGRLQSEPLNNPERVAFYPGQGEDGRPLATRITLYRTPEQIIGMAMQCAENGDYADAAHWLEKYLLRFPNASEVRQRRELWKQWGARGDYPKGNTPLAHGRRSLILEENPRKALDYFRKALEHIEQREEAAEALAKVCVENNWIEEAIQHLLQAARRGARCKVYERLLADLYARAGKPAKALDYLEGLLAGVLESPGRRDGLLLSAAERELELHRPAQALRRLDELSPESAATKQTLTIRISAHLLLGQTELAMQILQEMPGKTQDERIALLRQFMDFHQLLRENIALRNELDGLQQAHRLAMANPPRPEGILPEKRMIVVIGDSTITSNILSAIARSFGLTTRQLDFQLDYHRIKQAGVEKYRYNDRVAGILVGPCPHKMANSYDCNSLLDLLREEGFPPFEEIRNERGELKITRSSYRQALERLLRRIGPRLGIHTDAQPSQPSNTPRTRR